MLFYQKICPLARQRAEFKLREKPCVTRGFPLPHPARGQELRTGNAPEAPQTSGAANAPPQPPRRLLPGRNGRRIAWPAPLRVAANAKRCLPTTWSATFVLRLQTPLGKNCCSPLGERQSPFSLVDNQMLTFGHGRVEHFFQVRQHFARLGLPRQGPRRARCFCRKGHANPKLRTPWRGCERRRLPSWGLLRRKRRLPWRHCRGNCRARGRTK